MAVLRLSALLLVLPLASAFVLQPAGLSSCSSRARASTTTAFFDLKKMLDPEDAMGRGVLADDLAGGDGSPESLAKTKAKQAEAKEKGLLPSVSEPPKMPEMPKMEMPKLELPKFELPNPFGGDKK